MAKAYPIRLLFSMTFLMVMSLAISAALSAALLSSVTLSYGRFKSDTKKVISEFIDFTSSLEERDLEEATDEEIQFEYSCYFLDSRYSFFDSAEEKPETAINLNPSCLHKPFRLFIINKSLRI